jgi:hypothetical protein
MFFLSCHVQTSIVHTTDVCSTRGSFLKGAAWMVLLSQRQTLIVLFCLCGGTAMAVGANVLYDEGLLSSRFACTKATGALALRV